MLLEGEKSRWSDYRRALRRRDKPAFDELFEHADAHADASGYQNAADPMMPILLSMLLEHQKRLNELEASVRDSEGADAVQD